MSETPIGQHPPGGGRVKVHADDRARARAGREERRARRDQEAAGPVPVPPELAHSALAVVLEQINEATTERARQDDAFAARIEAALAGIADPDAVAAALASGHAAAREAVAVAQSQVADAETRRVAAEAAAASAIERAEEAESDVAAIDERLQETEDRVVRQGEEIRAQAAAREAAAAAYAATLETERQQHVEIVGRLEAEHGQIVDQLRGEKQRLEAALEHVRSEVGDATNQIGVLRDQLSELNGLLSVETANRSRAEGEAEALRVEVERSRRELADVRSEIPGLVETACAAVREAMAGQHAAEVETVRARAEIEVARLQGEVAVADAKTEAAVGALAAFRADG